MYGGNWLAERLYKVVFVETDRSVEFTRSQMTMTPAFFSSAALTPRFALLRVRPSLPRVTRPLFGTASLSCHVETDMRLIQCFRTGQSGCFYSSKSRL